MDQYLFLLPADIPAIPVEYTIHESILESPLEILLESLLEIIIERLHARPLEKAQHLEEQSFPLKAFGYRINYSLWKIVIIDGSKSVKALIITLIHLTHRSKCFWNYNNNHRHHRHLQPQHQHHQHHYYHHLPQTESPHIWPNQWEASSRFHWEIWIRDLLTPMCNCVPVTQDQGLPFTTL